MLSYVLSSFDSAGLHLISHPSPLHSSLYFSRSVVADLKLTDDNGSPLTIVAHNPLEDERREIYSRVFPQYIIIRFIIFFNQYFIWCHVSYARIVGKDAIWAAGTRAVTYWSGVRYVVLDAGLRWNA